MRRPARCLPQLISCQATEMIPFAVTLREIHPSPVRSPTSAEASAGRELTGENRCLEPTFVDVSTMCDGNIWVSNGTYQNWYRARKGSDISRRCAGIVVAEQNGSQSAFGATAVLLARPERKLISVSPGARNR